MGDRSNRLEGPLVTDSPTENVKIDFRSDVTVDLVKSAAADSDVLWAARVSTAGEQSLEELQKDPERSKGLINYLMRDRHGSPFEHNSMTFFISAPIFVFREFMRHRVGWSYNEESGRYRELQPVFYVPDASRKLVQEGRPGKYVFVDGTQEQHDLVSRTMEDSYRQAYATYQEMLAAACRPRGRPLGPARRSLLLDVRHVQRALADALPRAAHPARARRGPVLPAAGDRDGRREDGGALGPADAADPRCLQQERPCGPVGHRCPNTPNEVSVLRRFTKFI